MAVGRTLMDKLGILAGGDGEFRADQADAGELLADDILGRLLHDTDDAEIEAGTKALGHCGDGVARHGGALHAVGAEELEHMAAQLKDLIRGLVAVGAVGAVAEVDDVLTGQDALQLAHDGQSADAAVHHADGIGLVEHGKTSSKCNGIFFRYCTTGKTNCKQKDMNGNYMGLFCENPCNSVNFCYHNIWWSLAQYAVSAAEIAKYGSETHRRLVTV